MYEGWLCFGGNEVINNERVRSYAASLMPRLSMPLPCGDEKDGALHRIIEDEPYQTPMLDEAPWVDHDNADTYGFCGILGLSVVGLDDSTRTATVVENNGDGGAVVGIRKGTRAVRVSGLMVATDAGALDSGMTWLSAVLDGDCDGPCDGSDLTYLSALTDPQEFGQYVTDGITLKSLTAPSGYWHPQSRIFDPPSSAVELTTPAMPGVLPCDDIRWHWTVSGLSGTRITLHSYSESGEVMSDEFVLSPTPQTFTISDMGVGQSVARSGLRVVVGPDVTVDSVTVEYRDGSKDDACFNAYSRTVREAVTIAGPTVVRDWEVTSGVMRQVEFTVQSNLRSIFGVERTVLDDVTNIASQMAPHDGAEKPVRRIDKTIALCTAPKRVAMIADPDCPKIPAPPKPAVVKSSCKDDPDWFLSYAATIPDDAVPLWLEAVPILTLKTADSPARHVRVRFFPRPGDWLQAEDLDPCSACGQFVIDYIPPKSSFVLDGTHERAFIVQGNNQRSSADHLLSGIGANSLFEWPVLTCGTGYMAVIDVDGNSHSVTGLDLSLSTRY